MACNALSLTEAQKAEVETLAAVLAAQMEGSCSSPG